MRASVKKFTVLFFSAIALASCQWDTVTIRHNFFEERFNLEQLWDNTTCTTVSTSAGDSTACGRDFKNSGYFDVPSKLTYIQMHIPEITNENPAPQLGVFEFNYQRIGTDHPLIESKGTYYGTGIPHSDTGMYYFTITESTDSRMIGEYTLQLISYFQLELTVNSFVLDDGTTISLKFTFRSVRWGG
ncbi:MAG: hypothetical protein WC366_04065 [Bacilli bacterium]|jgi:hypothetical protein